MPHCTPTARQLKWWWCGWWCGWWWLMMNVELEGMEDGRLFGLPDGQLRTNQRSTVDEAVPCGNVRVHAWAHTDVVQVRADHAVGPAGYVDSVSLLRSCTERRKIYLRSALIWHIAIIHSQMRTALLSQLWGGARHFARKYMYEKLTTYQNFARYLPEKYFPRISGTNAGKINRY